MRIEIDVRDLDCNIIDLPGDIVQMNLQTRNSKRFQIEIPVETLLKSKTIKKHIETETKKARTKVEDDLAQTIDELEKEVTRLEKYTFDDNDEIKCF